MAMDKSNRKRPSLRQLVSGISIAVSASIPAQDEVLKDNDLNSSVSSNANISAIYSANRGLTTAAIKACSKATRLLAAPKTTCWWGALDLTS
ncbi:MAG: putative salt-induced outer membrane protein YdiY [Candidatus Azotimanducaceae bacterium]|jgi:putative salt-induced outer membrane protein YdiY